MSPIFTPSKFGFASQSAAAGDTGPQWTTAAGDLFSGYTIFESEVSTSTKTIQATGATSYALTNLPSGGLYSGMSFNTSTGVLSGDFGDNATYTMTGTTTPAGTFVVGVDTSAGKISLSMGSTDTSSLAQGRYLYNVLVGTGASIYNMIDGNIRVYTGISSAP